MKPWLALLDGLWRPLLEILLLWLACYRLLVFLRGTRAMRVLIALVALFLFFFLTQFLGLLHIHWILSKVFAFSLLAVVIIFQPELRRALARLVEDHAWWTRAFVEERVIDELVKTASSFSAKRTGALIALERDVKLSPYLESGVTLDSPVTVELLQTIFTTGTPLHDGAVIIREGKVAAAGCLLPLSLNARLAKTFGTRHRAAIGLTEESDALVIVISEEFGTIAVSMGGRLTRELEPAELRTLLEQARTAQPLELVERMQVAT